MARFQTAARSDLAETIAYRLRELWDAYIRIDEAAHSAVLAREYREVYPDGTVLAGKPTAQDIAAAPIEDYWLTELQAWPSAKKAPLLPTRRK